MNVKVPETVRVSSLWIFAVIVGGALAVGFGVQQHNVASNERAFQVCVNDQVNANVVDPLNSRSSANTDLTDATTADNTAKQAYSGALAALVLTELSFQATDVKPVGFDTVVDQFRRALNDQRAADDHLAQVTAAAQAVKDANAYKQIDCAR